MIKSACSVDRQMYRRQHGFVRPPEVLSVIVLILASLFVMSCGNSGLGGSASRFSAGPELSNGTVNATQNVLVARYTISPTQTASVYVEFGTNTNYGLRTSAQPTPTGGGQVSILVAGMKQNTTYHMRAVVTYANGAVEYDADHTFTTGSLPASWIPATSVTTPTGPAPAATIPAGQTPASGVELASFLPGAQNKLQLVAYDPSGNIIWYYNYNPALGTPQPAKLLPNGDILLVLLPGVGGGGTVQEIDLAGDIINQFTVNDLNQWLAAAGDNLTVFSLNHDAVPLPNGHLLLLGSDQQTFTDLPGYPGQTVVTGNDIVDLDPNDKPVWYWKAFDHLDVNRHPMFFPDWLHANALVYSPDDGNLLLSLRHQSWVIKIDYENGQGSGNIIWRLGYQGDFTLDQGAPANWFSAQHYLDIVSPNSTGDFLLALFDNGLNRVLDSNGDICGTLGQPACYSRPMIMEVNETEMTAHVVWSYTVPFSPWGGVSEVLPNSNVFFDANATVTNPTGAQVEEVTQQPNPQLVWQLNVNGQNSYRTIHLPSLYPGVQW